MPEILRKKYNSILDSVRRLYRSKLSKNNRIIDSTQITISIEPEINVTVTPYTLDISPKSAFQPYAKKFDMSHKSYIDVTPTPSTSIKKVIVRKYDDYKQSTLQKRNQMVFISPCKV